MTSQITISIATVPDIAALRVIHKLGDLPDEGVLSAALHLHHQQHGHKTLPLYQQQIVSLVMLQQTASDEMRLHCLENNTGDDAALMTQFNELIGSESKLMSWDMAGFDRPLINYRLLKHGIVGNNYSQTSTISLREQLSCGKPEVSADLAGLSCSVGLPDITNIGQAACIEHYLNQQLAPIHLINHRQVLNSYLLYLRHQWVNAMIDADRYARCCEVLRSLLKHANSAVLTDYESAWLAA